MSKGLKVWHFGLVFGAFEITVFLVSPIIGASIKKIGVKVAIHFIHPISSENCKVKILALDLFDTHKYHSI